MSGFGMGLGWLLPLLLAGVLFYFFVNQRNRDNTADKSAKDILDERYARGEINETEYRKKCNNLKSRS